MALRKLIKIGLLSLGPNIFFEGKLDFGVNESHAQSILK
jgi:hypothetical protein